MFQGTWKHLVPLAPHSNAALLPVLLGTGFLLFCFPPERACFLDLTASHLVKGVMPIPADGPASSLPARQEE